MKSAMLHRSFKPAKCKTSCKLATSRLKLMKNRKGVQLNQMKRELAKLLESGQDQTARIRVEHVIREEKTIAAYDLIEIYCELIVARMPIIESQKNCPIDLKEAVTSVIFASPRCADIPELLDIRKHLTAKYGKEFTTAAVELRPECGVSRMLVEKLSAISPDGPTKIKVLKAIAEEHDIQWEPKAFGEKDAKPPDDLLNGPTTFENASTMHVEPPKFQAPPSQEQKHEEPPNNYEQNIRTSMGSQTYTATDTGGIKASSGASHPDVRHDTGPDMSPDVRNSGMGSERMEVRQSFHGDRDAFSMGRQNWNMDFKDATAAAQAAAESAEMASMAARAAAELSSQGRITRQYSSEYQKSSIHDLRDEMHQTHPSSNMTGEQDAKSTKNHLNSTRQHSTRSHNSNIHGLRDERLENRAASNSSVEKNRAKDSMNHSFHDRNPNITGWYSTESQKSNIDGLRDVRSLKSQNERIEKKETLSYSDGHRSAKRSNRSSSLRSSEASIDDDTLVDSISKGEGYSRKSSFEEEANKGETGTFYSEMSMKKQSRESEVEPLNDRQDSFESENFNLFGGERIEKQFSSGSSRSHSRTLGDDYTISDAKYDITEDPFVVIDQGSIRTDMVKAKSFADDDNKAVAFDEYGSDDSERIIDVGPTYDEVEPTSYFPSPDREPPTHPSTDTDAWSPKRNMSKSMEKSTLDNFGAGTFDYSDGPKFDSEDEFEKSTRSGRKGSSILAEERNSGSDELNHLRDESSVFNPINSFLHEVEENVRMPESSNIMKENELHSSSGSESGTELNFRVLTGGLRNKGYKCPPYTTPSTDASSSFKKSAEVPLPIDRTAPATVRSSFNSRVSRNADEKLRSTVSTAVSNSDSDSDSDESRASKDVNTKSSSKSQVTSFDHDSSDSSEDLQKQTPANRGRLGSGLSRRTKVTPSSFKARVRLGSQALGAETRDQPSLEKKSDPNPGTQPKASEPRTETHRSSQWGNWNQPGLEKQAVSKPVTEPKVQSREGSFEAPEPRTQTHGSSQWGNQNQPGLEKQAVSKPVTEPKVQSREGSFEAPEPRTQTHGSSQWGNRDQPRSVKQAVSKPVTEPKVQSHEGSFKAPEPRTRTQSPGEWRNRDQQSSEKQAAPKSISEPKTESYEGSSKGSAVEPPSRTRLAARRTEKQVASKPTHASIPSREGRSKESASASTVASNVDESAKKPPSSSSSSLSREDSTGGDSGKNASHVHPKLPDYDNVFAHFQALRANRQ